MLYYNLLYDSFCLSNLNKLTANVYKCYTKQSTLRYDLSKISWGNFKRNPVILNDWVKGK